MPIAIGGILSQEKIDKNTPIAYQPHSLSDAEKNDITSSHRKK